VSAPLTARAQQPVDGGVGVASDEVCCCLGLALGFLVAVVVSGKGTVGNFPPMNPIAFRRTKSKPVQRSRQTSPDAVSAAPEEESPSAVAAKVKKRAKAKAKLSFGDDEVRVLACFDGSATDFGQGGER
jgi:hypothetical protein